VGSAAPHRFFFAQFRGHLRSSGAQRKKDHTGMEKRRHHFALPAQSKMRLGTHDDAIVRLIDLL